MNVQLKASQTMIPIYNVLADRHALFATGLAKYSDGGLQPNDCAGELDQMFADMTKICEIDEYMSGPAIWSTQSYAYSAGHFQTSWGYDNGKPTGNGKSGKGKGGKGKGKGVFNHAFEASKGKGGKGKGGKGKGKDKDSGKNRNQAYGFC